MWRCRCFQTPLMKLARQAATSSRILLSARSPELIQQAHDLLGAPQVFGFELGFNLPAFVIALVITAILVIGIKESAQFNATIVAIKVSVVLFIIGLGIKYVNASNWGSDWSTFAPFGFSGIGVSADLHRLVHRSRRGADRHSALARRQYRGADCTRISRSRTGHRVAPHYCRRPGRTDQRDAGHAARPNPRSLLDG